MIAELADGREFNLPDDMDTETAGSLVRALLAAEKAMKEANDKMARMEERMTEMQIKMMAAPAVTESSDDGMELAAINRLADTMNKGFDRMQKAILADRILVRDEMGEQTRSRAVVNK